MTRIVLDIDDSQWKVDHLARVMRSANSEFLSELATQVDVQVQSPRPLIVLDLGDDPSHVQYVLDVLRSARHLWTNAVADQIEAQTKPARIPEPGVGAVVRASTPNDDFQCLWLHGFGEWRSISGLEHSTWRNLIDPTPVRDGITS